MISHGACGFVTDDLLKKFAKLFGGIAPRGNASINNSSYPLLTLDGAGEARRIFGLVQAFGIIFQ